MTKVPLSNEQRYLYGRLIATVSNELSEIELCNPDLRLSECEYHRELVDFLNDLEDACNDDYKIMPLLVRENMHMLNILKRKFDK